MAAPPLQVSVYPSLLGEDEGINPVALPELFSSGGCLNMYIDELGRAKKIRGFTALGSAITANGTGDSVVFRRIHVMGVPGGVHLIAQVDDGINEAELWLSINGGVSWSFLVQAAVTVSYPTDSAQYKDAIFICSQGNVVRKYTAAGGLTTAGATQSPTPTAVDSTAGTSLNGTYQYKLVSVKADGVRSPGSVASTAVQVQNEAVALSWSADADTNVTAYELYRTTGTGKVFWFVTTIEGRTTVAYIDNTPDRILLENRSLQEHGDAPPTTSNFCATHKDRVWYGANATNADRAYWSDIGLPESVGTNNYLEFSEPEGRVSRITGMVGGYEGRLVVSTASSIWTVSGTGAVIGGIVDYRKVRTNAQQGWASSHYVVRVPEGAIWRDERGDVHKTDKVTLAYLSQAGDIRIFDGDNDTIISNPIKDHLAMGNTTYRDWGFALHDELRGQIIWFFPVTNETLRYAAVWNYKYGVWYPWDLGIAFGTGAVYNMGQPDQQLLLGGYTGTGLTYAMWTVDSFAGNPIPAKWMSGTLYGRLGEDTFGRESALPALPVTKRWRWADLVLQSTSGVTLTVEWFNGQAGNSGTAIGSTTTQPSDTSLDSSQRKILLHKSDGDYLHDEGMRLRVSDNATTGSWALEGLSVGFQVLPGLKRRSQ